MSRVNSLSVVLTGNATQLQQVLGRAGVQIKEFQKAASSAGTTGGGALKGIAVGAGIAAVGLVYAATQAAAFEKAMRNVSTIDATVRNNFAQTEKQVIALSTALPQSAKELAEGLYDISSSGFSGAKSLTILQASATAASAGLATTADSAKAITAVLNAYGLGADQATRVSDTLFQTVNYGVINFSELTGVISDTVGAAAAAGISIEQLGSAVATITLSGASASEAGTQLNRVITSLIKPNTDLQKAQKQLGVSFTDELKNPAIGLKGVLDQLLQSVGGNKTALSNLFSDIRASRGVLALEANDGKNYTRVLQEMGIASDNTGATQRALTQQSKGLSYQLNILKNDVNAGAITLGLKLGPALKDLIAGATNAGHAIGPVLGQAVHELTPVFNDLVQVGKNVLGTFKELGATVLPLAEDLAKAGFVGLVGTLRGVGSAASATTGFLHDNLTVVYALIAAYGLLKFQAIVAGFTAIGSAAAGAALDGLTFLALAASKATIAIETLGKSSLGAAAATSGSTAIFTAGGVALGLWALAAYDAGVAINSYSADAKKVASDNKQVYDSFVKLADLNSTSSIQKQLDATTAYLKSQGDIGKLALELAQKGKVISTDTGANSISKGITGAGQAYIDLTRDQQKLNTTNATTAKNTVELAKDFGISTDKVQELATAHKINLAGALDDTDKKIKGHDTSVKGLTSTYSKYLGVLAESQRAANPVKAATDDLTKANKNWQTVLDGVSKSFKEAIDPLQKYDDTLNETGQDIATNIANNLKLIQGENANIQTLISKGASSDLLTQLVNEGPAQVAAFAGLSSGAVKQASSDLEGFKKNVTQTQQELAQAANPSAYQAKIDAQKRLDYVTYVQSVQDSTQAALGILSKYTNNAAPTSVQQGLAAQRKKVLDAYLATLTTPVRTAVEQAIGISQTGSVTVAGSIVDAIIKAKPDAVFQASDLYTKVQGELDKLHGKDLQVILDDLASGNIAQLIIDLGNLSTALGKVPASLVGVAAPGVGTNALGIVTNPFGAARGGTPGPVRGAGSQRGDKVPSLLSPEEWVIQAPSSRKYGSAVMRSVNDGTATIIPHFSGGGTLAPNDRAPIDLYGTGMTEAGLAAIIAAADSRVVGSIASVGKALAALASGASGGGGSPSSPEVTRWTPLVLQVLAMLGQPASFLPNVLRQISTETGGDPGITQGIADSNSAQGILAEGLMQVIPGTFAANAGPFELLGPFNPLASIYAGLHYALGRYGSLSALGQGHGYAGGGQVGGDVSNSQVNSYLEALAKQKQVDAYLAALAKSKKSGGLLGFLAQATTLKLGAHDLAVEGIQDAYGMPERNGTWDQKLTDFVSVNTPHVGAESTAIRYLQLALKRPVTGRLASGDIPALYKAINTVAFPDGSFLQNTLSTDANTTAFNGYLRAIVGRGFAPLASALSDEGVDQGLAGARQMASAPIGVLQRAQAAIIRTDASTGYGDALKLASDLAQYGGKVGLLGLASRSGSAISDIVGLAVKFPDVFKAVGSSSRLFLADMARLAKGEQPIAAYAGGAYEIKQDHIAMVHQGETVMPKSYAEPWRAGQAAGGGTTYQITFGAISVGDGMTQTQVEQSFTRALHGSIRDVIKRVNAGTGSRPG